MSIYNIQIVSHFEHLISFSMRETKDEHKDLSKAMD
jgi:hypothetical protein